MVGTSDVIGSGGSTVQSAVVLTGGVTIANSSATGFITAVGEAPKINLVNWTPTLSNLYQGVTLPDAAALLGASYHVHVSGDDLLRIFDSAGNLIITVAPGFQGFLRNTVASAAGRWTVNGKKQFIHAGWVQGRPLITGAVGGGVTNLQVTNSFRDEIGREHGPFTLLSATVGLRVWKDTGTATICRAQAIAFDGNGDYNEAGNGSEMTYVDASAGADGDVTSGDVLSDEISTCALSATDVLTMQENETDNEMVFVHHAISGTTVTAGDPKQDNQTNKGVDMYTSTLFRDDGTGAHHVFRSGSNIYASHVTIGTPGTAGTVTIATAVQIGESAGASGSQRFTCCPCPGLADHFIISGCRRPSASGKQTTEYVVLVQWTGSTYTVVDSTSISYIVTDDRLGCIVLDEPANTVMALNNQGTVNAMQRFDATGFAGTYISGASNSTTNSTTYAALFHLWHDTTDRHGDRFGSLFDVVGFESAQFPSRAVMAAGSKNINDDIMFTNRTTIPGYKSVYIDNREAILSKNFGYVYGLDNSAPNYAKVLFPNGIIQPW